MNLPPFRFLLISNRMMVKSRSLSQVLQEAVDGGVDAFLLREPDLSDSVLYTVALHMRKLTKGLGIRFLISRRVDICLAVDADGVHLNSESIPVLKARELLGEERLIGYSAHSAEEALNISREGVDYLTLSPIFHTRSKPMALPLTPSGVQEVVSRVEVPVLALGGLNDAERVEEVVAAGAAGIAVMSAVLTAHNPKEKAAELRSGLSSCEEMEE
jgi:thiamine-phosphate pyrophosphorylase